MPLYFTAGPNNEQDGIFGRLEARRPSAPRPVASPAPATAAVENPAAPQAVARP
ncbi:MAG: hypothetical protein WDN28_01900 [Chthoniobacter sp.]